MNVALSIILTLGTMLQVPFFEPDAPEKTVYFFCHSKLIDVPANEQQHVVVTDVYSKTLGDEQVWEMVSEWTDFVNAEFDNGCQRTSDLNQYNSLEEAKAHLQRQLLKDLDRNNTIVEKVNFHFSSM